MAKKQNVREQLEQEEQLRTEQVEERVNKIDQFFKENSKPIWICTAAIVIIVLAVICYINFYLQPKKAEAREQMFPAEAAFMENNWELALKGDGNTLGFEQVLEDYGAKGGQSIYFYAGVCELKLGNYENAVNYLKKYNGKDDILKARALGALGDAYVGLGENSYKTAISCYDKAAAQVDNIFTASYLMKAGELYEEMGNADNALTYYKKIKDQYPQSIEGYDIDKYITRIEAAQ